MFTKDTKSKIKLAYQTYTNLVKGGMSNAVAKKSSEVIIREALSEYDDQHLIEYSIRLFFANYKVLDVLINSELCTVAAIKACSSIRCIGVSVDDAKKVLLLKFNDDKLITQWLLGNFQTRQAIEKYNSNDTILQAIRLFNQAGVDCSYYVNKYNDPLTLKRVGIIIKRDSTFNVDPYDRYQLAAIANHATSKELLEVLNPSFLPDTISTVCKLMKQGYSGKEVLAVLNKYNDIQVVRNYFIIKEIVNEPKSRRYKSFEIARTIDNTFITVIAKCPSDKNIPKHIIEWYSEHREKVDVIVALEKAIDKVDRLFPFMTGIIKQLNGIYPELSDLNDAMLDDRSREKEEKRNRIKEAARKERLEREVPLARIAVQLYIGAVKEDSILSAKQYCANNDVDYALFTKYVKVLKEAEDPLYAEYSVIAEATSVRALISMKSGAKSITKALAEKKKSFTLYDYYTITKFDMSAIHRTMTVNPEEFSYADLVRFRNFWEKYRYDTPMNRQWFYNDYIKIKGREITRSDKDKILGYMSRMRYPFIIPIYREIVRKYVSGEIEIN